MEARFPVSLVFLLSILAPRLLSTALPPRDPQGPTGSVFSVGISLRDFLPEDYANNHNSQYLLNTYCVPGCAKGALSL